MKKTPCKSNIYMFGPHLSIPTPYIISSNNVSDIPGSVASGRKMEGSLSLPGGYQALHLTWPC